MAFSDRPFAGLFQPIGAAEPPAPMPMPSGVPTPPPAALPMPGPVPAPPSLAAGPPTTGIVAGAPSGGVGGGFDWQRMLQMLLPLIIARSQGARASFLQGWQRAEEMARQRDMEQQQLDLERQRWTQQYDINREGLAFQRQRLEADQADRDERRRAALRQEAQAHIGAYVATIQATRNPEARDRRIASFKAYLERVYGPEAAEDFLVAVENLETPDLDTKQKAETIDHLDKMTEGLSDEDALAYLQQSDQLQAAIDADFVVQTETGEYLLRRPAKAPKKRPTAEEELLDPEITPERRRTVLQAETDLAAARRAPEKPEKGEGKDEFVSSPYLVERSKRIVTQAGELIGELKKKGRKIAGYGHAVSVLPESDAWYFATRLDTLKANILTNELVAMRAASKTGGAVGNVSDREGSRLESALGALNPWMAPEHLIAELEKVQSAIQNWAAAMQLPGVPSPAPSHDPAPAKPKIVSIKKVGG